MIKTVKIGEIKTEMVGDINKTDVMNVFLRIGWGAETTSRIAFKPTEDLKTGDGIQVTIEKIYEEPELNEEKEAAAGEVTEASEAVIGEEAPADEVAELPKAEDKRQVPTAEIPETTSEAEGEKEDTAEKI